MAPKPSPDSLIHCAVCGEDYSATYRRCPFCGAKNDPAPPQAPPPADRRGRDDYDDGYVFDGQDLFDDEPEEDYRPARPKGGKRLAEKPGGRFDLSAAPINWPRLITFLCSLVIIVAALIIVFTVIYPQLRGSKDPATINSEQPSGEPSTPVAPPSLPAAHTDPVIPSTDPAAPSAPVEPNTGSLISLTLNKTDFTMRPDAGYNSFKLVPTFNPSDWTGTVTWTSSDESLAKVAADGTVTYAAQNITTVRKVVITASAGGLQTQCIVYIAGPLNPSTPTGAPTQSDPPAAPSTSTSSSNVTVGRPGTIVNAEGGLRVRSGPGTTYEILATLLNGNSITVLSDEGNGWFRISYVGTGGQTMNGYIMGDYISTN